MDYTQPDPPASGENSGGSTPAYQPPSAGGPPPSQQPYQPSGGYQAAPPPPPPKKGFNWLACCGISCVVVLIVGGIIGFCTYRMAQPFIGMVTQVTAISTRIDETDLATIKAGAVSVTAAELAANPALYEGQWLKLEGEIAVPSGASSSNFSAGDFSSEDTTNYEMAGNIIVMDVTCAPKVGTTGDDIIAYGQCYAWDLMELGKIPFVGQTITEEIKKDPTIQGNTTFIAFFAKEVALAPNRTTGGMDTSNTPSGDSSGGASGWVK